MPPSVTKDDIDPDAKLTLNPGGIESQQQFVYSNRRRRQRSISIFATFDKAEFLKDFNDNGKDNGKVDLEVTGQLKTGQYFYATDTIHIRQRRSNPHRPPLRRR